MSTQSELWKNWEGRVADGKFPLRQWLGGSDHSAVFLTERTGAEPQKAAIKLIPADSREAAQLSRWADAAKLSHPHLIRLFEFGCCQIDETRLLYVVMEYAEENLAEILPLRPLSAAEASQMLRPAAEALDYLHRSGFVHGRIKPSNIMAVGDQLKISADRLCKSGERGDARTPSVYDAPELVMAGPSPAADIWSLGATLLAVLTQNEPNLKNLAREPVVVPETVSQAIREIARRCLQIDPQQRCTASDILNRLQPQASRPPVPVSAGAVETRTSESRSKRWIAVPIAAAALVLVVWVGSKFISHQPSVPAAEVSPTKSQDIPAEQSPAPFAGKAQPAPTGTARGSVLHQVMPDVSQNAQNTIQGRLKVVVDVSVDASGNVSDAKFVSRGPSTYFANRALAAARAWKFNPPQVNGRAAPSEWVLRFQFRKTSIEVFPVEKHP
ncbi:MAG: TonB family protein [Candidatus Sulfotelmatobacter sp.]